MTLESLFNVLLPVLSAGLATLFMGWLKKGVTFIGTLPAVVQQLIVAAGSWGLVQVSLWGVALTTFDITQLASSDILSMTALGLTYLFHLASKKKTLPAA